MVNHYCLHCWDYAEVDAEGMLCDKCLNHEVNAEQAVIGRIDKIQARIESLAGLPQDDHSLILLGRSVLELRHETKNQTRIVESLHKHSNAVFIVAVKKEKERIDAEKAKEAAQNAELEKSC